MARIETDPNYANPTFPRATAPTDLFHKEDVQSLAAAVSTHNHAPGYGAAVAASAITPGLITSAMIADGTIQSGDLADWAVTQAKIADGAVTSGKIADGTIQAADIAPGVIDGSRLTNPFGLGAVSPRAEFHVEGAGGVTWAAYANSAPMVLSATGGVIAVHDTPGVVGNGGVVLFGAGSGICFAGIKGFLQNGTANTTGKLSFGVRRDPADAALTEAVTIDGTLNLNVVGAVNANQVVTGTLNVSNNASVSGNVYAGALLVTNTAAFSGAAITGYGLTLPNVSGVTGQDIAFAHPVYSCVDHATELGLNVTPISDPVGVLKTLTPVRYDHTQIALGTTQPDRDAGGNIISTPTYGMSAKQVATLLPELVGPSVEDPQTIDYSRMLAVLWAACQVLEQRMATAEAKINV